jgi:hypothetical protein
MGLISYFGPKRDHVEDALMGFNGTHCPAVQCIATSPVQIRVPITDMENAGAKGDWLNNAKRCTACGCVYSLEGLTKVVRGNLSLTLGRKGWEPSVI